MASATSISSAATTASGAPPALTAEKWGFPLQELYRLAFAFYKQNSGKAIHLSYEDNLKLIAFKQQAALGPFNTSRAPALGVLDVIGRDRQQHWQLLGEITREQAMEGFVDLLDTMCSAFRPYIEAVRQDRDETLRKDLKRMELEKEARERKERAQQELLEEGYKEELQRRQLQDALNKQTYQQFKLYAEKQFPGNPEQQAVLIHQLQREHYHQYMQQLHLQNQNQNQNHSHHQSMEEKVAQSEEDNSTSNNNNGSAELVNAMDGLKLGELDAQSSLDEQNLMEEHGGEQEQHHQQQGGDGDYDDYVMIRPAKIWTRPDIEQFKTEVSAGDGDGVITIGHGDTVTVRVPTNMNGKCIFWEFATDSYDIGFGIYFEWAKPVTNEVTVHVSDSDEDEDCVDEDYLSTTEDLESGSIGQDRGGMGSPTAAPKAPISIIVPIYRRECYNEVYVGSHSYPGEGVYLLKFDNSYSIWRSKTLYYRVYYER
ncbi:Golgi resident protein GCP60 [Drosophila bipectinata]|uniref:Golgi resident protein GCP60 n=1 Tax=Drosophila bipectinata TaxID=42026 RepID=UPI001C8A4087|nr:Golgi resident protein GCP60 [Drosophila bipectinata]